MTPSVKIQTMDPVGLDEGVTQSTREADYQLPKLKATRQSCSRTNQTFLFKLGNEQNRSLDPRNCEGIQNPLCLSTQTMEKETHKSKVESPHQFCKRSHFSASTKRSNQNCTGTTQPIHINTVCCETSLKRKTNFQLKEFESVCTALQVQDGRSGYGTQAHLTRLLHDEVRPPGRLFLSANPRQLQTLYTVHLSGNNIRVPVPPIRALQCTLGIHQTIETSHFTAAIVGDTNCNISGRYAHFGSESRQIGLSVSQHCQCGKTTGLSYQAGKMLPSSNTTHRMSGFPDQLHRHAASSTEGEAPKHSVRMQEGIPESFYVDYRVVSPFRQNDSLHTNETSTGFIALLCTTATPHKHTAPPEDKLPEQDQDFLIKGLINRPPMVDLTSNNSIQQHSINPTSIRYGHIHRCIHTGIGGPMQWNIDGVTLDSPGIQEPHQRCGVKSCPTGHQVLSSHSNTEATAHQLQMDNSIAVAYVNKRGGTKSSTLAELAVKLWAVCHQNNIWITAQHLPGTQNVDADWASCHYTPQVDLFAPQLNHQLPKYVSRHPDPEAMSVNAMTLQWNKWTSFIHPSIVMLLRILKKIREDQSTFLLIAQNWPAQTWYPLLLQLLINIPAILPMSEHTIYLPFNWQARHPLWRMLKLAVWPLSGDAVKVWCEGGVRHTHSLLAGWNKEKILFWTMCTWCPFEHFHFEIFHNAKDSLAYCN